MRPRIDWQPYIEMVREAGRVGELAELVDESIAASEADAYEFSERIAIQIESREAELGWSGKTTTERAIDVLEHPDKFPSYMADVAKAWLRNHSNVSVFERISG